LRQHSNRPRADRIFLKKAADARLAELACDTNAIREDLKGRD
jgi:hypothetical protein